MSAGTVVITGGSGEIGSAISHLAAQAGYSVCVNYLHNASNADRIVEAIRCAGGSGVAIRADVRSEPEVVDMFQAAAAKLGPITALVNNAGITGGRCRVEDVSASVICRVFETNVVGSFLCAREAVRRMSTARGGEGGAIVNISSRASQLGNPGEWVHYAASKGALDTFTIGLAKEVAVDGIRVNSVNPGLIHTGIHAASGSPDRLSNLLDSIPMARIGTPAEVADAVIFLLSSRASYITGACLPVGGGR